MSRHSAEGWVVPIDGPARGLAPGWAAAIVLIGGFALYVVVGQLATLLILAAQGVNAGTMMSSLQDLLRTHTGAFLGGNALGLLGGLGVLAILCARLQSTRPWMLLRFQSFDRTSLLLSIAGLIVLLPVVLWAGLINEAIPLPQWLQEIERQQLALIEDALTGDLGTTWMLLFVAIAPGLCEELFFRGFVQRNLERGVGAALGIILSGVIFSVFHLRLSQVLPLALLGVYMAYLVWRTGSIWVPIIIHVFNNGLMVVLARYGGNQGAALASETIPVPWYLVLSGAIAFLLCMRMLHQRGTRQQAL